MLMGFIAYVILRQYLPIAIPFGLIQEKTNDSLQCRRYYYTLSVLNQWNIQIDFEQCIDFHFFFKLNYHKPLNRLQC